MKNDLAHSCIAMARQATQQGQPELPEPDAPLLIKKAATGITRSRPNESPHCAGVTRG